MTSELARVSVGFRGGSGRSFSYLLLGILLIGLAYHAFLILSPLLQPYRFPTPYAVPIFDTPFALAALAVGYLCLERQRLRQDFRCSALGNALWLTALLAIAHILAQPDYPGTPGVNPGVAPYFFFLSYLLGFVSIGLALHYGDRPLRLSDRSRLWIGLAVFGVGLLVVMIVLRIQPLLPSLVMKPGRLTPFAIWVAGISNGLFGVWGLWGGVKKFWGHERDWFAGFLLFAAVIWLLGLIGFLLLPFRYAVSWYLAGIARPLGVLAIFVGLVREQVWLYREARARLQDLEGLHTAGQSLAESLEPQQTVETITTKALEVSGATGAILFRLDPRAQLLRPVSRAGQVSQALAFGFELPVGTGLVGLAVAEQRPVWSSHLEADDRIPLAPEARRLLRQERQQAALAIPLLVESGEVFGALLVSYREEREFADADVQLLSAFGTQASVALENARSFEQLALKAQHDSALQAFGQELLEAIGEEAILNEAVRVAKDLLQADYVSLFRFDPKAGGLRLEVGLGWQPGIVGVVTVSPSAESLAGYAFLHKASLQVEDLSQERRFSIPSYIAGHGVQAGIAVPIGVRDQPIGVLGAYYRTPHRFSDEENRVLLSLAHQTALGLEKVRLYAALQANLQRLQETQAQLIQADKLKALGTLLSGMAHEINNPLTSILLAAQLLKQQHALPAPILKRMNGIEEEAERASRIVRDLLVFARRKPPERSLVDLNEIVKAALTLQAPGFDLNNIRVVSHLEPTLPAIWADPHQLQQVFFNLFTNAAHAMKSAHGQGILTVRSSRQASELCTTVDDNGPGVPPEHLGRIFDPFFTTKGAGEGTGLGLSLSIGIIEAHGGHMQAENLPDLGARFTIRLPIGRQAEPGETPAPETLKAAQPARILVVDDEEQLRAILIEVFTALGHQVDGVATGREAIASLERRAYDLIALDLRLPDIDGKEVWRWILSWNPALAARVVFMTGDTMSPESEKFLQEAGRPLLRKPMSIEHVRQVVGEVLRAKPADAS